MSNNTPLPTVSGAIPTPGTPPVDPSLPTETGMVTLTKEMLANPGTAIDVLSQPNQQTNALTTSAAINATTVQDAAAQHASTVSSPGFFNKMGIDVYKALNFLNKPLQEVQKDYKFVHAVYSNYGMAQGILATLGLVAGGTLGAFVDEPLLGVDAAGALERHLFSGVWSKAYSISEDPNAKISFGRDISNGISDIAGVMGAKGVATELKNTDKGLGKIVSGISDTGFDFSMDPLMRFGALVTKLKGGDLVRTIDGADIAKNSLNGIENKLGVMMNTPMSKIWPQANQGLANMLAPASGRFINPQVLDAVKNGEGGIFGILNQNSSKYVTALDDIANIANKAEKTDTASKSAIAAASINYQYSNLGGPFAQRIADMAELKKVTPDDIHEVLRNSIYTGEKDSLVGGAVLPSRTVLRMKTLAPMQKYLNGTADKADLNWLQKGYSTFTGYMATSVDSLGKLSTSIVGSNNKDASNTVFRIAKYFGGHDYAIEQVGKFLEAKATGHPAYTMNMYNNLVTDVIKMSGAPDDSQFVLNLREEMSKILNARHDVSQAVDEYGNEIGQYHTLDNQVEISHPTAHQMDNINFPIPNFIKAREAMYSAGMYKKYLGKLDTFVSDKYTNPIFKPLALMTAGFGLRVAASELLPAISRFGIMKILSARVQISAAKSSEKRIVLEPLVPGEEEHLIATALHVMGTTNENGKLIDPLKNSFTAVQHFIKTSNNTLAVGILKRIPTAEIFDNTIESIQRMGGHIVAPEAVTTGMDATGYGMSEGINTIAQKEARKVPTHDKSFVANLKKKFGQSKEDIIPSDRIVSLTAKDNDLRPQLVHNINKEMKNPVGQNIAKDLLEATKGKNSVSLIRDVSETATGKIESKIRYEENSLLEGIDPFNNKPREAQKYTTADLERRAKLKEKGLKSVNEHYGTNFTSIDEAKSYIKELEAHASHPDLITGHAEKVNIDNIAIEKELKRLQDTISGKSLVYKDEMENSGNPAWLNRDLREFATDRVRTIKGMVIGRDGTLHKDIMNHMANNKELSLENVTKIKDESLPASTGGHITDPSLHAGQEQNGDKGFQKIMNSVVNLGFKKVLDPMINWISREPLFQIHYSIEKKSLAYEVNAGLLSPETAGRIAQERAIHAMLPEIHNTALRSQFAQITRNLMPFYFAQEQAMKRAWRAANDTSAGIPVVGAIFSREVRLAQMTEQAMNNPAFVTSDGNGNSYVNLPVVGEIGTHIQNALHALHIPVSANLPMMAQGNLTSLKSVIPGIDLPGLGPIITVPMNALSGLMPSISTPIDTALGLSANRGVFESLIPSKVFMDVWDAMGPDQQSSALANATIAALQTMSFHNQLPGATASPQEIQAAISKAKDNARSILMIKALVGLLSPLSPKIEQGDSKDGITFRDEWNNMLKPKSQGGLGMTYADALIKFVKEHPPLTKDGATDISYTISNSTPSIRGANFNYSDKAINWINDKSPNAGGLLFNSKTSTGAAFLIPQAPASGDSYKINQALIMDHLRQQRSPDEMINQFYISQGNYDISQPLLEHNKLVAELTQNGNKAGLTAERARWSTYTQNMANSQPIWYANYNSGVGTDNAKKALSQLETIFSDPKLDPNTEQSNLIKGVLQQYYNHQNLLNSYKASGYTSGIMITQEKAHWTEELSTIVKNYPQLTNVINTVFSKVG